MNQDQRLSIRLLALAALLTVGFCAWSFGQWGASATALLDARTSVERTNALKVEIVELRQLAGEAPRLAQPGYHPGPAIDQALDTARAKMADLSITATTGRPLPESELLEVPIGMPTVEGLTLEQAVKFLAALSNGPVRHQVEEIDLSANKNIPSARLEHPIWNLSCQVSYYLMGSHQSGSNGDRR